MTWWINLTQGQGSVISGGLTALGAVSAVLFAGRFFSGKVKSIQEALNESEKLLLSHRDNVSSTLAGIQEELAKLDAQSGTLLGKTGKIEGALSDYVDQQSSEDHEAEGDLWDELRLVWLKIRDLLEDAAASDEIDGRTRAKYGRIDRRMYWQLIQALDHDGNLGGRAKYFDEALAIWQSFKSGKKIPKKADLEKLAGLLAAVQVLDDDVANT